jgi:transcriptional regulator with XRE-family HTH domain
MSSSNEETREDRLSSPIKDEGSGRDSISQPEEDREEVNQQTDSENNPPKDSLAKVRNLGNKSFASQIKEGAGSYWRNRLDINGNFGSGYIKKYSPLVESDYWELLGPLSYIGQKEMKIPATRFGLYCMINNINMAKLAAELNTSRVYLMQLKFGRWTVTEGLANRIANHFNVPVLHLFEGTVLMEKEFGKPTGTQPPRKTKGNKKSNRKARKPRKEKESS